MKMKNQKLAYLRLTFLSVFSLVMFSCDTVQNQRNEDVDVVLGFFEKNQKNTQGVECFLIVPAELTCESCVQKIVDFVTNLNIPKEVHIVFSSYSQQSVEHFIGENSIKSHPNISLDIDNYFFENSVLMIHPVLFEYKNDRSSYLKTELYPVSVEESLLRIFSKDHDNLTFLNSLYGKEFKGVYSELIIGKDSNKAVFITNEGELHNIPIDDKLVSVFEDAFVKGQYYIKNSNSFKYIEYINTSDSTATFETLKFNLLVD